MHGMNHRNSETTEPDLPHGSTHDALRTRIEGTQPQENCIADGVLQGHARISVHKTKSNKKKTKIKVKLRKCQAIDLGTPKYAATELVKTQHNTTP